jgi:hypothetical protein
MARKSAAPGANLKPRDAIQLLKADHAEVSEMLKKYENGRLSKDRKAALPSRSARHLSFILRSRKRFSILPAGKPRKSSETCEMKLKLSVAPSRNYRRRGSGLARRQIIRFPDQGNGRIRETSRQGRAHRDVSKSEPSSILRSWAPSSPAARKSSWQTSARHRSAWPPNNLRIPATLSSGLPARTT